MTECLGVLEEQTSKFVMLFHRILFFSLSLSQVAEDDNFDEIGSP